MSIPVPRTEAEEMLARAARGAHALAIMPITWMAGASEEERAGTREPRSATRSSKSTS